MENQEVRTTSQIEDSVADLIMDSVDEPQVELEPQEDTEEVEGAEESEESEDVSEDDTGDDSDEESDDSPETEIVEMEIDGTLYEIPLALKDKIMFHQDYTRKTQETAEQRKAAEVALSQAQQMQRDQEFVQSVQAEVMQAQQLEATAEEYQKYLRDNIESLSSTDIEKIRFAIEDSRRQRDDLVQSLTQKQQEHQQAQEQSFQELLNKGTEVLKSKIPNWGEQQQKKLRDYGLSIGFTNEQMNTLVDPLQVEALWKASQYDALQQGKSAAVKKVQSAPSIKPKSRNTMPKETKAKLNLRKKLKSPNLNAKQKADLIAQDMGERFG